jgi:hypothetical protein
MQNNLNTTNPNHYIYETKHLKISILGGIRFNNLEPDPPAPARIPSRGTRDNQLKIIAKRISYIVCPFLLFNSFKFKKNDEMVYNNSNFLKAAIIVL